MDFDLTAIPGLGLLGLQGSNGNLKAPDTRVSTAQDARALLSVLEIEDNAGRSRQRALTKGMVDGNPPYDDKQRRAEGRGWECNLNFMEGQAIMNRTAVPYYNLFARVPYFVECRTAYQTDNPNSELWNASIQRRLHNMLKRWPDFNWNIQQISYWMRLHGIGFALPENDYSWHFRSTETGSVLVPQGSPSFLSKRIPYVFIRMPYRITELWEYIKDEKYAKEKGWNIEAVKLACKYGMRGAVGVPDWWAQPWEKYEQMLKNHDLIASWSGGDLVNCVVMLVREFSKPGDYTGKISKFMFTEFKTVSDADFEKMPKDNGGNPKGDFLFADPNCYDSYNDGLIPFFRNTGDGTWHSVRGYAMEAFKHLEVDNRLLCQMINRAFIDSSVVMQFPTERDRKRSQLAVWGTVAQLPAGAELKQTVIQGGVDGVVRTHMVLENHLSNNLGVFQPRMLSRQDGKGEQPTARQVDYQASSEASIGEGEITIWYQQLDALYNFIFMRASDPKTPDKEAQRFQKECLQDGVPKEALQDMEYVRANRQNGYGSPEMGIMKFQQGQMLVPMLPEDGKQLWLEDAVTQLYGPEKTMRYVPREHIPDDQDWEANQENAIIADGRMPILASGQDDVIHLTVHFQDTQQTLTPPQQGQQQDPAALQKEAVYAQTMANHVEQHIARLEKDPTRKKDAQVFENQFKQLAQYSEVLWRSLREAHRQMQLEAQQNQQATSLSALDQAKIQSVQTGAAAAAAKAQSQMANQRAKTLQQLHLKDLNSAQKLSLDRTKTAHDINLDYLTAAHGMNIDNTQTANDMAIERARELAVPEPTGSTNGQQRFGQ